MPPDFELNTFRFGLAFVPLFIGLTITKQLPKMSKSETRMFVFGALGYILTNVLTYSHFIKFLPLGTAGAILNGFEIIFCVVLTLALDR